MKKKKSIIMAAALTGLVLCLSEANLQTVYAMAGGTDSEAGQHPDAGTVKNSLLKTEDGLYYVEEDGTRAQNQWELVKNQAHSEFADGWYYFGANGKAFNYGKTAGVKKQINGKTYVFDDKGRMETGWLDEDGSPLDENDSPITDGVYYAGEDGALLENQWLKYDYAEEALADDADSGIDGVNYSDYSQIWMYFDSHFKRLRGSDGHIRQKVIGGNTYGFDKNGVMLPWWSPVASSSDAQSDAGEPVKFFAAYDGGKLLKDSWFWMYPSENMDEKDYNDQEYSWWRTNSSGDLYKNTIKRINGKYYGFDALGRMQTGFVLYQGRNHFVAQYDLDVWTSDQFKDGDVLGIEGANLYLFAPDELNDGSMQTGKNIKVELSDGTYTFGFGSGGIAYGNKNKLQKVQNTYYINGLRLDADDYFKYGVVQDAKKDCYVVDTNGRKITGDKRVLKDGDGGWILMLDGKFMARVEDDHKPIWHDGEQGPGFYHYDSSRKDHSGELIVQRGDQPDLSNLPDEEQVYIE